jgi:homoserine O-succinyltransferase/O-acetyltransferase
MKKYNFNIAILDFNAEQKNEGLRCILNKINEFKAENNLEIKIETAEVRIKKQLPNILDFDVFIGTGGPGNPIFSNQEWETNLFYWFENLFKFNDLNKSKKHCFFICHSFQMLVQYLNIAKISKRHSSSFGIMPIYKTKKGESDALFSNLPNPFFGVDSRDYQITEPKTELFDSLGMEILCLEKLRPHVNYERALMAIRFSKEIIGTQFHPEADFEGMNMYLNNSEKKKLIIDNFGHDKYQQMISYANDPSKLLLTENTLLPTFLKDSYNSKLSYSA